MIMDYIWKKPIILVVNTKRKEKNEKLIQGLLLLLLSTEISGSSDLECDIIAH